MSDLVERLRAAVIYCDAKAAVVSNIRKPRSDNDYGRAAQLHEEAAAELSRLSGMVEGWREAAAPFATYIHNADETALDDGYALCDDDRQSRVPGVTVGDFRRLATTSKE